MVIYVDTLFVTNFFMTFFLLLITSRLAKKSTKTVRLVLASLVGGAYSLIILAGELPSFVIVMSKLLSALVIILIAFKFYRAKSFFITYAIFFFSSLVSLGVVIGICYFLNTKYIAINNSTVYFDISSRVLVLSGFLAYALSSLIVRLHNRFLSSKELYTLVIEHNGNTETMLAFADNGNRLHEPFSNSPVIVAKRSRLDYMLNDTIVRYVPISTASSSSILQAFKPDKILLKTQKGSEVIENAYIALSDDINSDGFSAILNPEILSI